MNITRKDAVCGGIMAIVVFAVFLAIFIYWGVHPMGMTEDKVTPEFWQAKVKMAEVYQQRTGNDYYTKFPEDVELYKNNEEEYFAVFRNARNPKLGDSIKIEDSDVKAAIDSQIEKS